jgi:hypothetical protein
MAGGGESHSDSERLQDNRDGFITNSFSGIRIIHPRAVHFSSRSLADGSSDGGEARLGSRSSDGGGARLSSGSSDGGEARLGSRSSDGGGARLSSGSSDGGEAG